MKKYNKQIQITVELDSIAQLLANIINPSAVHGESVVEAIIGRLDANNDNVGITMLYNALNGFTNDVNFTVGQNVYCSRKEWAHWSQECIDNNNTVCREIGECSIVDINPYGDNKIKIRYDKPLKDGSYKETDLWVDHFSCKSFFNEPL